MAIGSGLEMAERKVAGECAGDYISGKLKSAGVPSVLSDMARPEYFINPTGAVAKGVWNLGSIAVKRVIPRRISNNPSFGAFGNVKSTEVAKDAFIDNPVALHLSRIENGGWDKLTKMHKDLGYDGRTYYDYANGWSALYLADSLRISVYSPEYNFGIPITMPDGNIKPNPDPIAFRKYLEQVQGVFAQYSSGNVGVSANLSPRMQQIVISHEIDHALHIRLYKPGIHEGFDFNKLSPKVRAYFEKANGSEIAARGSQIKDWLGFTRADQEITEAQLKTAAKHYVNQTGVDNAMTELFNSIVDWKAAAKWLNDNSTVIAGLGLGTYMYNQHNNNKDVQLSR